MREHLPTVLGRGDTEPFHGIDPIRTGKLGGDSELDAAERRVDRHEPCARPPLAAKQLFDEPYAGGAVDSLNIELDSRESPFFGPCFLDELEPFVIDVARVQVGGR